MKRNVSILATLVFGLLVAARPLIAVENMGALADYVAKPDDSFTWHKKSSGKLLSAEYAELILTSQTWQNVAWKHQLFILKPSSANGESKQALLFITGGNWNDSLAQPSADAKPPRDAALFVAIAERLKTPVAVLLHVPQQPLFDGRREDAIIALTFARFLQTGDSNWPLLLPMVKSAVRGMDAVQAFAKDEWSMPIDGFSVTGASKRGWTTWLTGAVDPRAKMIAPMVIDMLNMAPQMRHAEATWGAASEEISDYTQLGLLEKLDSKPGKALQAIVDPYSYRRHLTQPKLIVLGTNDRYWPLDALNLYWDDLQGEKYILYVPNNGHGIQDFGRVVGSLNAMHQAVAHGARLPKLTWKFVDGDGRLKLSVASDLATEKIVVWVATSDDRDFRDATWKSFATTSAADSSTYDLAIPATGFAAVFGEASYSTDDGPYSFSTNVRIVGDRPASP